MRLRTRPPLLTYLLTIKHPDMEVSPLWLMPPVYSILNVFLDTPVQQDFQVGVLNVVGYPSHIQDTTQWAHIDRCDGNNEGVGSMRRPAHHMGHTMEVWILKELRTHGLFSLTTTVTIIRVTVQEVQDTTCVHCMVMQAIRYRRWIAVSGRSAGGGTESPGPCNLGAAEHQHSSGHPACPGWPSPGCHTHNEIRGTDWPRADHCTRCSDDGAQLYGCTGDQTHFIRKKWTADQ